MHTCAVNGMAWRESKHCADGEVVHEGDFDDVFEGVEVRGKWTRGAWAIGRGITRPRSWFPK
jgi:hypothetical protein